MPLEVIGAGLGRTGTLSLKSALERLGLAPCYHMMEALGHPPHAETWLRASDGEDVDWEEVFAGYRATVDWPACAFWQELIAAYPDAKVLLSVRPSDRWYASFRSTIYEVLTRNETEGPPIPEFQPLMDMGRRTVTERSFGGALGDRDETVAAYEAHNTAVRAAVPEDNLLVFDVAEGWSPLCRFLGRKIPDEPFPNINDRAMFRMLFGLDDQHDHPEARED